MPPPRLVRARLLLERGGGYDTQEGELGETVIRRERIGYTTQRSTHLTVGRSMRTPCHLLSTVGKT